MSFEFLISFLLLLLLLLLFAIGTLGRFGLHQPLEWARPTVRKYPMGQIRFYFLLPPLPTRKEEGGGGGA
jgi:hypothetical protein